MRFAGDVAFQLRLAVDEFVRALAGALGFLFERLLFNLEAAESGALCGFGIAQGRQVFGEFSLGAQRA